MITDLFQADPSKESVIPSYDNCQISVTAHRNNVETLVCVPSKFSPIGCKKRFQKIDLWKDLITKSQIHQTILTTNKKSWTNLKLGKHF